MSLYIVDIHGDIEGDYEIIRKYEEPFINKPCCISSEVCEHDKQKVLEKISAEISEWYWKADKQALAEDPCVVDAMIDLFIRTIDKYKSESEVKDGKIDRH